MALTLKQQQLVNDNINLVYALTQRYRNLNNYEDIVATGMLALCEAADKFDEIRGNNFSTFAWSYIRGRCMTYVNCDHAVKPSRKAGKYLAVAECGIDTALNIKSVPITKTINDLQNKMTLQKIAVELSPLQQKILQLLYLGYKRREICAKLNMKVSVIAAEIRNIKDIAKTVSLKENAE